jgi:hypothetical protein
MSSVINVMNLLSFHTVLVLCESWSSKLTSYGCLFYRAWLSWSGVGGGVLVDEFHVLVFLGLTWSCPLVVYYILW